MPNEEITASRINWTQEDVVMVRQFLQSHPRLLVYLWQQRGTIKAGDHSSSDEIAGFERCFNALKSMSVDTARSDENTSVPIDED